jgi:hypothetical protein
LRIKGLRARRLFGNGSKRTLWEQVFEPPPRRSLLMIGLGAEDAAFSADSALRLWSNSGRRVVCKLLRATLTRRWPQSPQRLVHCDDVLHDSMAALRGSDRHALGKKRHRASLAHRRQVVEHIYNGLNNSVRFDRARSLDLMRSLLGNLLSLKPARRSANTESVQGREGLARIVLTMMWIERSE